VDDAAAPGPRSARASTPLRDLNSLVPDRRRQAERIGASAQRADDELVVVSWNVFHGRDAPPGLARRRLRSILFRTTLHNETHVQVNRSLYEEFAGVLSAARWDVCLLQECPPRWADRLADACQAGAFSARTSRNWLAPLRNVVAEFNPDLMGSWEGGCNLTLARPPWQIVEGSAVLLNPLRERRRRERRRLALTRLVDRHREVCVGNLHLSTGPPRQSAREARRAAETALDWARGAPLVLAGDFNMRPETAPVFDELCKQAALCGTTNPQGIDHILAHGLEPIDAASPWDPQRRELDVLTGLERRRLRLSDHAPVEARFRLR
jgi:endonuclease/exonuclease/phosphatase family metal-dependent hydrolase